MLGQGLMPEQYHPIVDVMSDRELTNFLTGLRARTDNIVSQLPSHQQFIENYCKAESI